MGLQRHHEAKYIETIKRLQDGAIGDIHTARVYWNGGGVWIRDRKPGDVRNGVPGLELVLLQLALAAITSASSTFTIWM